MQNISLRSLGIRKKQNFEIVFVYKSDTAVLTFTFRFLSSPLFSLFFPHFFSLAGHLVGLILLGNIFRKPLGILGLDERKGRWEEEQDFQGNFLLHGFLPFSPVSMTGLCSFWHGLKDLFTMHNLADKVVLDH